MATTLEDVVKALGFKDVDQVVDSHAYGEVKSINTDGTYQVSLNGSDTTVKCARLTGAKVGDTVLVLILSNGYAVATGCVGGDTDALDALTKAETAEEVATNLNQYFWYQETGTDNGAHVTQVPQEDFIENPQGGNTIITSLGLAIRNGLMELATFTGEKASIGAKGEGRISIGPDGISLFAPGNIPLFTVNKAENLMTAEHKTSELPDIQLKNNTVFSYSLHYEVQAETPSITVRLEGYTWGEEPAGYGYDHVFTFGTPATENTGAPFNTTIAYDGQDTFTFTTGTMTTGLEATFTRVDYYTLFAPTPAISFGATDEDSKTGPYSIRGGYMTSAVGENAIAFGKFNDADGDNQFVIGRYNAQDTDKAFVIGNGTNSGTGRSNAFTVDWNGNTEQAGNAKVPKGKALLTEDATGYEYPLILDNSQNLWIGARQTATRHHVGQTLISSGHDGTAGNETIYISVPNASNNNATNYGVYHAGYKPTKVLRQTYSNVAITNRSGNGAYYSANLTRPSGIPTSATILAVTVSGFSGASASFTPSLYGNALMLMSDVSQTVGTAGLLFAYQV